MEFKKLQNKDIQIIVNNEVIGVITINPYGSTNFKYLVKFNFMIKGYVNTKVTKTQKEAKKKAEELYNNLMNIHKKLNVEIIKLA